ncbi:hypothetical protein F4777DRAFT_598321 [Nemania sp. FL0916]|nr:hypothetical protein F4777DRAFT_598321 [Nemania sp. FL0916]
MVNNIPLGNTYPSRPALWSSGGAAAECHRDNDRAANLSEDRQRSWTTAQSLRELCQISGSNFFVAAEENGKVICFSTPVESSKLNYEGFFDKEGFAKAINRHQSVTSESITDGVMNSDTETSLGVPETAEIQTRSRQRQARANVRSRSEENFEPKKRQRAGGRRQRAVENDNILINAAALKRGIKISDSSTIYAFYDHYFKGCQQTACKILSKAWIKAVAPKKQSTHPYTKGDDSRPDWWPKTYRKLGENTERYLLHKEPDHIGKDERVFLLCHILRLLVEPPHKQHPAIRKVDLNLDELESVTFKALSSWFSDRETPRNQSKRALLKDLFRVARLEARYRDGEIDGDTEVFVVAPDNESKEWDTDSDDEAGLDQQRFTPASSTMSSMDPYETHTLSQIHGNGHNEPENIIGGGMPQDLPARARHYSQSGYEPSYCERSSYVETQSIGTHTATYNHSHLGLPDLYPSSQDPNKRPSQYNPPAEYSGPPTPVVYSHWPISDATSNPTIYGFQSHPTTVQNFGGPLPQAHSYTAPPAEISQQATDAHHGNMYVPGGIGHSPVP